MIKSLRQMLITLTDSVLELSALLKNHLDNVRPQQEVLLKSAEVADLLNMNIRSIQRYGRRGVLQTKIIGGTVFYYKSDVFNVMQRN